MYYKSSCREIASITRRMLRSTEGDNTLVKDVRAFRKFVKQDDAEFRIVETMILMTRKFIKRRLKRWKRSRQSYRLFVNKIFACTTVSM